MGRCAPARQLHEPRGWRHRNPRDSWSGRGGFHPGQTLHHSLEINAHPAWGLTLTRRRSCGTAPSPPPPLGGLPLRRTGPGDVPCLGAGVAEGRTGDLMAGCSPGLVITEPVRPSASPQPRCSLRFALPKQKTLLLSCLCRELPTPSRQAPSDPFHPSVEDTRAPSEPVGALLAAQLPLPRIANTKPTGSLGARVSSLP